MKKRKYAYDIISSALKSKEKPDRKVSHSDCEELNDKEIEIGEKYIRKWISNYSYEDLIHDFTTLESLVKSYKDENCSYFKIQLFRLIISRNNLKNKIDDDSLLKYIDQTYHVENDYLYSLDFRKFEMTPEFMIMKCDQFISTNIS